MLSMMNSRLLTIFLCTLLYGCQGFLEKPEPTDSIQIEDAFQNIEDFQLALNAAYNRLLQGEAQLILYPDFISDNSSYIGPGSLDREISRIPFTSTQRIVWFWTATYQAVNQANLTMQLLADHPDLGEQTERDRLRGEALFLRGFAYFEMVRLYARPYGSGSSEDLGLPLMTAPTTAKSELTFPVRASVQATYDQIHQDLNEAASLLPDPFEPGRAHRFAALAHLARVAFQQKDYQKAADLAAQVLAGPFSLNESPRTYFETSGTSEEIWVLARTPQDPGQLAFRSGQNWIRLSEDLLQEGFGKILSPAQQARLDQDSLQVIDLRFSTLVDTTGGNPYSLKYDSPTDDIPVMRLPEIMLIRAESLARLSQEINSESVGLLNELRTIRLKVTNPNGQAVSGGEAYVEYQATDFASPEELIDAIIRERRVEYVLEGNRFHDLIRLERNVQGVPFDDDALRWPIPQSEIDANNNLVQNPGY